MVDTIISPILEKLSNLSKVSLLIAKLLSQDLNPSWLTTEPKFLTYEQYDIQYSPALPGGKVLLLSPSYRDGTEAQSIKLHRPIEPDSMQV